MSIENALAFLSETQQNAILRARVAGLKGPGALSRLVTVATESGFFFTEDDYRRAVVELAQGELSDASLDRVIQDMRISRRD